MTFHDDLLEDLLAVWPRGERLDALEAMGNPVQFYPGGLIYSGQVLRFMARLRGIR